MKRPIRFFTCHAHDDYHLSNLLFPRLMAELRASKNFAFSHWRDDLILPGHLWDPTIQAAILSCDFGLIKASVSLFTSRYVLDHELPHFVGAAATKPCLPIFHKPIDFKRHDTAGLDPFQFFGLALPTRRDVLAFSECTTSQLRDAFARQLAERIEEFCALLP